jgi:hypothetical protein
MSGFRIRSDSVPDFLTASRERCRHYADEPDLVRAWNG